MEAQFEPVLNFSSLSLTVCTVLATYFGYKCFKAPGQTRQRGDKPSTSEPDSLSQFGLIWFLHGFRFFVIFSGVARCVFTLFRPLQPSVICPNPGNLIPHLFVWNVYTTVGVLLTCLGGCIRIASYLQLGSNFTFELNKSDRLVVDGIYQYVRL